MNRIILMAMLAVLVGCEAKVHVESQPVESPKISELEKNLVLMGNSAAVAGFTQGYGCGSLGMPREEFDKIIVVARTNGVVALRMAIAWQTNEIARLGK